MCVVAGVVVSQPKRFICFPIRGGAEDKRRAAGGGLGKERARRDIKGSSGPFRLGGHKIATTVSLVLMFQIQEVLKLTLGHEQFRLKWVDCEVNKD